jgi:two-component system NarL family sensor kinase
MHTVNSHITVFIIITTAIVFLLSVLIVTLLYLYHKRQLAHDNNVTALRLDYEKNRLQSQIEVQEHTFHKISREIHDNINLSLILVKLNLNTLGWEDVSCTRNSVDASVDLLGSAIYDLNNLSKTLNPEVIANLGLMMALQLEVDKLIHMAHLQVEYNVKGEPVFLNCEKELIVFRIIQESFNNIIKHSKASNVWLELYYRQHLLDIMIRDNGVGFIRDDSKKTSSAGLLNMQTRTKSFGGQFSMKSCPEHGTQIFITVPYN